MWSAYISLRKLLLIESFRNTEISKLEQPILHQQYIVRFDIPVNDTGSVMQILQPECYLGDPVSQQVLVDWLLL